MPNPVCHPWLSCGALNAFQMAKKKEQIEKHISKEDEHVATSYIAFLVAIASWIIFTLIKNTLNASKCIIQIFAIPFQCPPNSPKVVTSWEWFCGCCCASPATHIAWTTGWTVSWQSCTIYRSLALDCRHFCARLIMAAVVAPPQRQQLRRPLSHKTM